MRTQEFVNLSISVGGDGEIARDGEAGAGSGRDRRRGRRKGVPRGRKQGVWEHACVRTKTTMFSSGKKKGEAFRLFIILLFILRVSISIPLILAKE